MSNKHGLSNMQRNHSSIKKLTDDLALFDKKTASLSGEENEMLSLMVDEAFKGVDIVSRYPSFYRKLLANAELREAFIDILESLETEKNSGFAALPQTMESATAFRARTPVQLPTNSLNEKQWRIAWDRTIEQLQAIFFPRKFALSREIDLFETSWFTLLREDVRVEESLYSILLECGLMEKNENGLSTFVNVAVTLEADSKISAFPLTITLMWGKYRASINIPDEGRFRFPDIPFETAFDTGLENITAAMEVTLDKSP